MNLLDAILLGIIQGITEWLPISSSGHLVLYQQFFELNVPIFFDIMLHVATLFVIFVVFWRDILKILKAVFTLDFKSEYGKLALYIIIGTIPTGLIGYFFKDFFKSLFQSTIAVGIALLITGLFLYLCKGIKKKKKLKWYNALLIGTVQGLAIIPGISRSGATISLGILQGLDRKKIATFSFLLAIPAILGAMIVELPNDFTFDLSLLIAMLTSFVVGYIALKILLKLVIQNKFYLFAYYCWIVGIIVIILSIL
jgi:undecaprenyl-diphosphatase